MAKKKQQKETKSEPEYKTRVQFESVGPSSDIAWAYLELAESFYFAEHIIVRLNNENKNEGYLGAAADVGYYDAVDEADNYNLVFDAIGQVLRDVSEKTGVEFAAHFRNDETAHSVIYTPAGLFAKELSPAVDVWTREELMQWREMSEAVAL